MPKATITFDLSDPDDKRVHMECMRAQDLIMVMYDFNDFLRNKLKYEQLPDGQYEVYETISDEFHRLVNEADLSNLIFE